MAIQGVKCRVANCKFWQQGEQCDASIIEVNVDQGQSNPQSCDQTSCHTFAMKRS